MASAAVAGPAWNEWLAVERGSNSFVTRLSGLTATLDLASPARPSKRVRFVLSSKTCYPAAAAESAGSPAKAAVGTARVGAKGKAAPPRAESESPVTAYRYFCDNPACACPATRLFRSAREHWLATRRRGSRDATYVCQRQKCVCGAGLGAVFPDEEAHDLAVARNRWRCTDGACGCDTDEVYADKRHHDNHVVWLGGRQSQQRQQQRQEQQEQKVKMQTKPTVTPAVTATPKQEQQSNQNQQNQNQQQKQQQQQQPVRLKVKTTELGRAAEQQYRPPTPFPRDDRRRESYFDLSPTATVPSPQHKAAETSGSDDGSESDDSSCAASDSSDASTPSSVSTPSTPSAFPVWDPAAFENACKMGGDADDEGDFWEDALSYR